MCQINIICNRGAICVCKFLLPIASLRLGTWKVLVGELWNRGQWAQRTLIWKIFKWSESVTHLGTQESANGNTARNRFEGRQKHHPQRGIRGVEDWVLRMREWEKSLTSWIFTVALNSQPGIYVCFVGSMWVGGGVVIAGLWVSVLYTYKLLSTSDQSRQGKHEV